MVDGATLEKIVRSNRANLDTASRALVQAANRGGGEDNITAILFEVVDGDAPAPTEPDEETRERATVPIAVDPDEEDTLHPEDNVAPPPPAPAAVDTMIASAEDIRAAVSATEADRDSRPDAEQAPALEAEPEKPHVPWWRFALALLVIAVLAGLIVLLVFWGLAR
jgi:protein phosphatase